MPVRDSRQIADVLVLYYYGEDPRSRLRRRRSGVVRARFCALLEATDGLEVVAEAVDGADADAGRTS